MAAKPTANDPHGWEGTATKLTLISLFLGILGTFSFKGMRRAEDVELKPFDLLVLGLSSYRIGKMIAYERIGEPLRDPFTETTSDFTGVGETVVAAEGVGARRAIGELVSCPICL